MKTLSLDYESYCDLDLTRVGVSRYARDPSLEVLLVAWSLDDGETVRQDDYLKEGGYPSRNATPTTGKSKMPKLVTVHLEGTAPYSQSRKHDTSKLEKETPDAYEQRTWREKCSVNDDGEIVIPAMAFKQALDAVAKRLGDQIPGKGKATYTKNFKGGVICSSDVPIRYKKSDVPSITISANSDGVRGSGKRVNRTFPQVPTWKGVAEFAILDDTVTPKVFERHLIEAGRFIGVGRFRPENGGLNGRFVCKKFSYKDV